MKKMNCVKCGMELNDNDPRHKGLPPEQAIKAITSDHASKQGCDWPAANQDRVLRAMNR